MPKPEPHPEIAAGEVAVLEVYYAGDDGGKQLRVVMCPSLDDVAAEVVAAIVLMNSHGDRARALELLELARARVGDAAEIIAGAARA